MVRGPTQPPRPSQGHTEPRCDPLGSAGALVVRSVMCRRARVVSLPEVWGTEGEAQRDILCKVRVLRHIPSAGVALTQQGPVRALDPVRATEATATSGPGSSPGGGVRTSTQGWGPFVAAPFRCFGGTQYCIRPVREVTHPSPEWSSRPPPTKLGECQKGPPP